MRNDMGVCRAAEGAMADAGVTAGACCGVRAMVTTFFALLLGAAGEAAVFVWGVVRGRRGGRWVLGGAAAALASRPLNCMSAGELRRVPLCAATGVTA